MKMTKHSGVKAALIALAVAMMVLQGCTSSPASTASPALSIKALDGSQKAAAGTNLTFILKVKSSQKVLDNVTLSIAGQPSDWTARLSAGTFDLGAGLSKGFMLTVSIPPGAKSGSHGIKVKAASNLRTTFTATKTVTAIIPATFGAPLDLVRNGNSIKVDYTGYLTDFWVFDTSVRAVGSDLSIAKSSSFNAPADNVYQPLTFTVGASQMIKGFDTGVLGMGAGQSKTIRVIPADGYGKLETTRINLIESFPMHRDIDQLNFTITYGEAPYPNKVVTEPYWGWKVQVLDVTRDKVTLLTIPDLNSTIFPYGWETKVTEVNGDADGGAGRITVRHYPGTGGNVTYRGMKAEITSLAAGYADLTYNLNTGNPLAIQDLYFSVRIVSISQG